MSKKLGFLFTSAQLVTSAYMLAACSPKVITQDRPVRVAVPVPAPCTTAKPAPVVSLRERFNDEQWAAMDARQLAAAVAENAIRLRTYGEQLHAATAACP